ncbi:MAG: hypothetical protein M1399_07435 [Actinobacteria bacterium]|nr:hypothetical protein [Actinomycetota bacterium]
MKSEYQQESAGRLAIDTHVEVRDRYQGTWARGFAIAEWLENGYRVRRISDDTTLPDVFTVDEVRPSRRRQGLWWY